MGGAIDSGRGTQFLDPISLNGDDSERLKVPRGRRWRSDGRPTPRPLARCCCTRASADTVGELAFFLLEKRNLIVLAVGGAGRAL